ncbi:MAG: hypothetical protein FWF08_10235 [Oscillospiraceae bacterium]|nr:hypothetical protein [Oscillospiraceae bacterium]
MKKIFAITLVLVLAFSLAACGSKGDNNGDNKNASANVLVGMGRAAEYFKYDTYHIKAKMDLGGIDELYESGGLLEEIFGGLGGIEELYGAGKLIGEIFGGLDDIEELYGAAKLIEETVGELNRDIDFYVKNNIQAVIFGDKRTVVRDGKSYEVFDKSKTYEDTGFSPPIVLGCKNMNMTGSGIASFNGKNMPYEEYDNDIQYFFDGDDLAGIKTISQYELSSGVLSPDLIVIECGRNVPDSIYEIPGDYQRIDQ